MGYIYRRCWAFAFAGCLLNPSLAGAAEQLTTIASVGGVCEQVLVAGQPNTCVFKPGERKSGVIYMQFPNGHVVFTVGLKDGRLLTFVGERDSQPNPEKYWLYLSRVRFGTKGTETVATVGGLCIVSMTIDGAVWHRVDCRGEGENGSIFQLNFKSDENKITVNHAR
jgi:hypothetical protein